MTYKIIVEFQREELEDIECEGCGALEPKALAVQLAKELQEAYDELGMAGTFQVLTVEVEGKTTNVDPRTDAA